MKTTLMIDNQVMVDLKQEAARQGKTMSELVDAALRQMLTQINTERPALPPLPSFDGGPFLVDIADRDALYRAMEEEP